MLHWSRPSWFCLGPVAAWARPACWSQRCGSGPSMSQHAHRLNKRMGVLVTASALALWCQATCRTAWGFPSNEEMRDVGDAPAGISVKEFIDKSVVTLAREMLLQQHLDAQTHGNQPVVRGVEVELFAPGDVGILVRYRW